MAQYFTFDGLEFHHKDAFKKLVVIGEEQKINSSSYMRVLVRDQDSSLIYMSQDYKISEDNHNTQNGYGDFSKHMQYIINCIVNI